MIRAFADSSRPIVRAIWAVMALLNLSAGVMVSTWPERQTDLDTIQRWGRTWLVDGADVYHLDLDFPDYPPHAIVALSPLGLMGLQTAVWVWSGVNLALAVVAVYLAVRIRRPEVRAATLVVPMLMLLCWGGFRTLLQFSLLALVFGLAAMRSPDKHPVWSGVSLGLALMKPQIAAPFVLWALFTRRFRLVAISLAVVATGFLVYCLRAGSDPVAVTARYLTILRVFYSGDAIMLGLGQVRPLFLLVTSNAAFVDTASASVALVLLIAVCVLGLREGRDQRPVMYSAPALAGIWSLLTFYHLTYGFLLLLPTATLMLWQQKRTAERASWMFWALQLWLMFDPRTVWRYASPWLPASPELDFLSIHADRVLMPVLFVIVARMAVKTIVGEDPDGP